MPKVFYSLDTFAKSDSAFAQKRGYFRLLSCQTLITFFVIEEKTACILNKDERVSNEMLSHSEKQSDFCKGNVQPTKPRQVLKEVLKDFVLLLE